MACAARDERIKTAFEESNERTGGRRIQAELIEGGAPCNIKTISRCMRRQSLVPKAARRFKVTTDSNHSLHISPNVLGRDFHADCPNQKWASNITYLMTSEGWLYLAVIIDLYSRAVIGWSMSTRMKADLVCDALTMALKRRGSPNGVIVHSDREPILLNGLSRCH